MFSEQDLKKSPLFQGINYPEYQELLTCFQPDQKSFRGGDTIYDFSAEVVGVMERGQADLIRIGEEGVVTILEDLRTGDVFGKTLAFAGSTGDQLKVISRRPCDVVFIDYSHILGHCSSVCRHHGVLLQNMLKLTANKAQALSRRIDVLSRRSIREKLLCYFRQMSQETGSSTFTIPFSLGSLADYIASDRSAMMRELKYLREEGIIRTVKRQFTLQQ